MKIKLEIYEIDPGNIGLETRFTIGSTAGSAVEAYCDELRKEQADLLWNAWKDGLVEVECIGKTMTITISCRS